MFGIGGSEFVIIALVALFIFGPDRLPGAVKSAARMLHDVRRWTNKARADLTDTLGPEFENFDLADLNPKRFVQKHLLEGLDDVDEDEAERRRARRAAEVVGAVEPEPVGATALGATVDADIVSGTGGDPVVQTGADVGGLRVDTLALTESASASDGTGTAELVTDGADASTRRSAPHVDFDAT